MTLSDLKCFCTYPVAKEEVQGHTLRQSRIHNHNIQYEKREQRNESLHSNAMSRCSRYKLINEKYSFKFSKSRVKDYSLGAGHLISYRSTM